MIITLTNIDSSIISEISYNQETNKLIVEYLKETKYEYSDVTESAFFDIMNADSKGKHINLIKNDYEYEKISDTKAEEVQ